MTQIRTVSIGEKRQPVNHTTVSKTLTSNTSTSKPTTGTRKPRGEAKKCRKVYGMEKRDLWCTACRWKKACQRFTDWDLCFTPLQNVLVPRTERRCLLHPLRVNFMSWDVSVWGMWPFKMSLIPPGHKGCSFLTASIVEHWDFYSETKTDKIKKREKK